MLKHNLSRSSLVALFLIAIAALTSAPTSGSCDDDTLRNNLDQLLSFNDGTSTTGDDGLVEVETNDPKCPKILWYPPLGHFICMPPEIAGEPRPPRSERPAHSSPGTERNSRR